MYSLEMDWETVEKMVVQVLKEDYKSIHEDLQKDHQHPDDKAFYTKLKDAFGTIFRYYMAPIDAEEYIKKVEDGTDDEEITVHMDDETTKKLLEAALYSAINTYFEEQKDAIKRQADLGNTES